MSLQPQPNMAHSTRCESTGVEFVACRDTWSTSAIQIRKSLFSWQFLLPRRSRRARSFVFFVVILFLCWTIRWETWMRPRSRAVFHLVLPADLVALEPLAKQGRWSMPTTRAGATVLLGFLDQLIDFPQ